MPLTTPPYYNTSAKPRNWTKIILITLAVVIIIGVGVYFYINNFQSGQEENNAPVSSGPLNNTEWNCDADVYNCGNFTSQGVAQVAFDSCISQGKGDVWNLDGDNDGKVCTSYDYPALPGL